MPPCAGTPQVMMGVLEGTLELQLPDGVWPPLARLVRACLQRDAALRPTFDVIVREVNELQVIGGRAMCLWYRS